MKTKEKLKNNFDRQILTCEIFLAQSKEAKRVNSIRSIERKMQKPIDSLRGKEIVLISSVLGCLPSELLNDDFVFFYSPEGKWRKERKEAQHE